jgi:hypothetical protein
MNAIPLFPVLVLLLFTAIGWTLFAGARAARRRAQALSVYAATLPSAQLAPLHDRLLERALAHYAERELSAGKPLLEYAVTIRDRLDQLAGREHGPLNKARHRSQLLPAAYRLRGYPNPFHVREFEDMFRLSGPRPDAAAPAPAAGAVQAQPIADHAVQAHAAALDALARGFDAI